MAGGLMNLISYGTGNIILNGNPKKTFFKVKYNKYTNYKIGKKKINITTICVQLIWIYIINLRNKIIIQ